MDSGLEVREEEDRVLNVMTVSDAKGKRVYLGIEVVKGEERIFR